MARVLLFGKDGQLGRELRRALAAHEVTALGRAECDFADATRIAGAIREHRPELVVNAAAYTAVDKAEAEPDIAQRVNAASVEAMGAAAHAIGARVVHYSTDYVFDGESARAYQEGDATAPLNVYGASKLAGEQSLLASGVDCVILRTSWVFSSHGRNFVDTMLRLGAQRSELRVVDDQHGAPTSAEDLAHATAQLVARWDGTRRGIYHCTAQGEATWAEFARAIFEEAGMQVNVTGIPTSEYPTPARRPRNSRLDCDKLSRDFGIRLPRWRESLRATLQRILAVQ